MKIDKAIRKQNKSYKYFLFSMCSIFVLLPTVLFFSMQYTKYFYDGYLAVIEVLIIISIFFVVKNYNLKFDSNGIKLNLQYGIIKKKFIINCDKVVFVHAQKVKNDNFNLIILTTSRFRNNNIFPVDKRFLQMYPYVAFHYYNIKKKEPQEDYFYIIIKSGGYNKYELLDIMYKNCMHAFYTEEALNRIIEYRNSKM